MPASSKFSATRTRPGHGSRAFSSTRGARLEWVRCLRDSALVEVVHVGTHDNLADMFTKALSIRTFTAMRNRMMSFRHIPR